MLAGGLGREPPQGRRALLHRGRALAGDGLTGCRHIEEDVQGTGGLIRSFRVGPFGFPVLFWRSVSPWEQTAFAENAVTDRLIGSVTPLRTRAAQGCQTRQIPAMRPRDMRPVRLRDALRQARIEAADRTGVVVESARCRSRAAGNPERGARSVVRAGAGKGRPVRSRHQPGRNAAAVDRRRRAHPDGTRQADLPLRAGHPLRPHRARRIPRRARDRRCRHRLCRAPHDRARACAWSRRRWSSRRRAEKPRRRGRFWTFVLGFIVGALALFGLALFASLRNL